jgi:hypothetical protein
MPTSPTGVLPSDTDTSWAARHGNGPEKSNHGVVPHGHHTAATAARSGPDLDLIRTMGPGPRLGTQTLKGSRLVRELLADAQRWATILPAEVLSQIGSRSRPTHDRSSARSSILRHELRGSS